MCRTRLLEYFTSTPPERETSARQPCQTELEEREAGREADGAVLTNPDYAMGK